MKPLTVFLLLLTLNGCSKSLYVNGKEYRPYGLVNEQDLKSDNVVYAVSTVDIVVGVITCESFLIPGYIIGWDMYEPQRLKDGGGK